jgi:Ca2+-binding RTX toxin-like protein
MLRFTKWCLAVASAKVSTVRHAAPMMEAVEPRVMLTLIVAAAHSESNGIEVWTFEGKTRVLNCSYSDLTVEWDSRFFNRDVLPNDAPDDDWSLEWPTSCNRSEYTDTYTGVSISGSAGPDYISSEVELPTTISGGAGNDILGVVMSQAAKLYGGGDQDALYGGNGGDTLEGGDGDDNHLFGNGGNDYIFGGLGNDRMYGGDGDDWMYGDNASDPGTGGNDWLVGGDGNDRLYGGYGNDELDVNGIDADGNDTLYGGYGNDTLGGTDNGGTHGSDVMYGGYGDDVLDGRDGLADSLYGEAGNDTIYFDSGLDSVTS